MNAGLVNYADLLPACLHLCVGDRETGVLPSVPSAEQGGGVLDSVSVEVEHRTGACMLVESSTVRYEELVRGQTREVVRQLAQRDVDGPRDVALVVLILRPDVDPDRLFLFHELHRLGAVDPAGGRELIFTRIGARCYLQAVVRRDLDGGRLGRR